MQSSHTSLKAKHGPQLGQQAKISFHLHLNLNVYKIKFTYRNMVILQLLLNRAYNIFLVLSHYYNLATYFGSFLKPYPRFLKGKPNVLRLWFFNFVQATKYKTLRCVFILHSTVLNLLCFLWQLLISKQWI